MFSGAVYQAAALSKAFVVKKFLIKEATIYPIEVILHVFIHACIHTHVMSMKHMYTERHKQVGVITKYLIFVDVDVYVYRLTQLGH